MKTRFPIVLFSLLLAFTTFGQDASLDESRSLQQFLELPQDTAAARKSLWLLGKTAQSLPADAAPHVYEAVCAGLIAIGDKENYRKVRTRLPDAPAFEDRMLSPCTLCQGAGHKDVVCKKCGGSGACYYPQCRNGYRTLTPLAGTAPMRTPCPICKGAAKCPDCDGSGHKAEPCRECRGKGRRVYIENVRQIYRQCLDTAIARCAPVHTSLDSTDSTSSQKSAEICIPLPLSEMAKEFNGEIACAVLGPSLAFLGPSLAFREKNPKSLLRGRYDIPLEMQSRHISFDLESIDETPTGRAHTMVLFGTVDDADLFGIVIPNDNSNVRIWCRKGVEQTYGSNAEVSTSKNIRLDESVHVDIRMDLDQTDVTVGGETFHLPQMNGVRMASINISLGKPSLSLENIMSYPSINHYETALTFLHDFKTKRGPELNAAVRKAAENGLDGAQMMYAGLGMLEDSLTESEIINWLLEAAKQGNASAQYAVGIRYYGKNDNEALKWLKKAAESCFHKAELMYGVILMSGEGVLHDYDEAKKWLGIAKMTYDIDSTVFDADERDILFTALRRLDEIK